MWEERSEPMVIRDYHGLIEEIKYVNKGDQRKVQGTGNVRDSHMSQL